MDITKGFHITEPNILIPWGTTEPELKALFQPEPKRLGNNPLREVTAGYFTTSCVSFNGLKHELGFHFHPRKNGRVAELEFFRTKYDIGKSFPDFQKHFVGEFGIPQTQKGTDGFPHHRWNIGHINIEHYVIDRFGPEEHMRITNLISKMDAKTYFKGQQVFELNPVLEKSFNLKQNGSDESGWRQFYSSKSGNWIKFFPHGEYHGGGTPHLILIDENEPETWLRENEEFENKIREELDKRLITKDKKT
jgi:hypothetical protein